MRKLDSNQINTVSGGYCYTCSYNYDGLKDTLDLIERESQLSGAFVTAIIATAALSLSVPTGIAVVGSSAMGLYTYSYEKQNHELSPWQY